MSRLITVLGATTALAAAVTGLITAINPKAAIYVMLVGTAAAAVGKELLDPQALRRFSPTALRRGLPARGAFARGKSLKLVAFALAASVALLTAACDPPSPSQVIRGVEVGAHEAQSEIEAMRRDGDLSAGEAGKIKPVLTEIETAARNAGIRLNSPGGVTPQVKRQVVLGLIGDVADAIVRLEEQNIIKPKGRDKLKRHLQRLRVGLRALRVVEATFGQESGA